MNNERIAKIQHYVPRMLLKHHSTGKKHHIFVFDKQKKNTFQRNINRVACENSFYTYDGPDGFQSLEPSLAKLEAMATPIVEKLNKHENISSITAEERWILCFFMAIQLTRTKSFREMFKSIPQQLAEKIKSSSKDKVLISNFVEQLESPPDNEIKQDSIQFLVETAEEFATILADKIWLLLRTNRTNPFMIGDNPITLQNSRHKDNVLYGNLGIGVKGIEIYLPLSSKLSLLMLCPSYASTPMWEALKVPYKHGTPLTCSAENIKNHNALQIIHAERYIMSATNNFDLALKILKDNPRNEKGPRMHVG